MFNNYQLQVLQILTDKWKIWEKTQVSLFTHEDKLRIDELRATMGLAPADASCNACFMDDISVLIKAYQNQLQTAENAAATDAENTPEITDKNSLVNTTNTQNGTEGGEGKKRTRKKK
jgi:hypothetical protein